MMSCTAVPPCPPPSPPRFIPPPPGLRRLRRRIGDFDSFLNDVIVATETQLIDTNGVPIGPGAPTSVLRPIGRDWDIRGDPRAFLIARLWAYVAEGVAAYTELTSGEGYIGTATDWTDVRRLAALVGYRPHPRVAARGWIRAELDVGANPVVPAGTRVQAPGVPGRAAQTFEVMRDTELRSEWDGLSATWPLAAVQPDGRLRVVGDPGFRSGDMLLFLDATPSPRTPIAIASVTGRREELGTSILEFDRSLAAMSESSHAYVAYRIFAQAGRARRLERMTRVPLEKGSKLEYLDVDDDEGYGKIKAITNNASIVLDTFLDNVSAGQTLVVCDWSDGEAQAVVSTVRSNEPTEWQIAPGLFQRVSKISFDAEPPKKDSALSVYICDPGRPVRHLDFVKGAPKRVRIHPAPTTPPERLAIRFGTEASSWEVFKSSGSQTATDGGLLLDLDSEPVGLSAPSAASANLVEVHHGETVAVTVGSGDAVRVNQRLPLPDAPIAYDLDDDGNIVPSLALRVDDALWHERSSLFGAGPVEEFVPELEANGGITALFGDGVQGRRLTTGRGNVRARYRVGGGLAGEVPSGAIDTLVGSVAGVQRILGTEPPSNGADQDDERRMRVLAPGRARVFDRAVSREDLVDLARAYPGVSHATSWIGQGPIGCACGGINLHLAFLRIGSTGVQPPDASEIASLGGHLDARRDTTVGLCVCAGAVSVPVVRATLVVSDRRRPSVVLEAVRNAVGDPDSPLVPANRELGEPLDRSDVVAVIHTVPDVLGVTALTIAGASPPDQTRLAPDRWKLVVPDIQLGLAVNT
jgi:hypothetical protein